MTTVHTYIHTYIHTYRNAIDTVHIMMGSLMLAHSLICSSLFHYTTRFNEIHSNYHMLTMHFAGFVVGLLACGGRWIWFCISCFNVHASSSTSLSWPWGPTCVYSSFSVLLAVVQDFNSAGMTRIICLLCCFVLWGCMLVAVSLDMNIYSALFFTRKLYIE